jgi:hypothetical protein
MGVLLVVALAGGFISGLIASGKGLSFGGYFILGALLPLIGVIAAAAATPAVSSGLMQLTPAPGEGWWQDPSGRFDRRYFDGRHWTRHVTRDADQRQLEDPLTT